MSRLLAGAALALTVVLSANAEGTSGSVGADVTAGSAGYRALRARASFDLSEDVYLAPRAMIYRSDEVDGTYKLFGLRLGYEPGRWSFGGDVAVQPRVDGYAKSSLGGDAAYTFPLNEDAKKLALDLGGGVGFIRHSDEFAAGGAGGRGRGRPRTAEFAVTETDVTAFGALRGSAAALTGRVTKSGYSEDLTGARRVLGGGAFGAATAGFPDSSASLTLKLKAIPRVEPFVSWTRTTFELGDPPSTALEAGAAVPVGDAELKASVESYRQEGFANRTYLSLGASVYF